MAESDVQQLAQAAAQDAELKAALGAATSPEDVVSLANARGIPLTLDDLQVALADAQTRQGELSEAELESVSGGVPTIIMNDVITAMFFCN